MSSENSLGRSLKKSLPEENIGLAEIIAKKVCGRHNQHVIMLFEGKTGTGKSYASLRLAFECSMYFASKLGGRPEDYFTLDNVGILTAEETIRIAKNIKPHGIYILDDAGAEGLAARKWQSEQNETMTKLLQTFRTNNNLLIMSSPDKGFVDKIARTLIHYKVTMTQTYYNEGFSLGKISTVQKIPTKDGSSNIYPFIRSHGVVFNYVRFMLPPEHIRKEYDKRRKTIEREMNMNSIAEMEGCTAKNVKEGLKIAAAAEENSKRKANAQMYKTLVKSGVKATEALKKASEATGVKVSQPTVIRDYNKYFEND